MNSRSLKITFVNPKIDIFPPIGICYLSSFLKAHVPDIEIELVEILYGERKKAAQKILDTDPDIIGFTTYTIGYYDIMNYCRDIKQIRPDVSIWLGGPHITSLPQSLPLSADIAIIGEGEQTALELCNAWKQHGALRPEELSNIPGIYFRIDGKGHATQKRGYICNLDTIPPPDISLLNMKWYTSPRAYLVMKGIFRGLVILSSRGCLFHCRFCQASAQWGRCRYHSAERVVSEIGNLRKRYPAVNAINIIDDLFIGDRERLRTIVRLIREKGLHQDVVFNVNGHVNLINEEVLNLLKSINVVQIGYGFESGSERILQFLKKGSARVQDNQRVLDMTNKYGIGVGGQFMIGTPGETEEDLKQTIEFIKSNKMSHVHLAITNPMLGTELWDICEKKGLVSTDIDWRKLDFGNIDNPDILYLNKDIIPWPRFQELLREATAAANKWNPVPSIRANFSYHQIYTKREFVKRSLQRMWTLPRHIINKAFSSC